MGWTPRSSDRFYRLIVRTALILRRLFQVEVLVTGETNLPGTGAGARFSLAGLSGSGPSRTPVPGRGAVVAITHFGYLDFAFAELMLWRHSRAQLRFLITKGAASHWFAGRAVHAAGHVVVDRSAGASAYQGALEKLRAGEYVGILPEAGVSRSFTVRELKTGAVRLAAKAGVPIIPVSVWGSHRLMSRGHKWSVRRTWRAPVRVHVSPAIRHAQDADVVRGTEHLRLVLQRGIDEAMSDFPLAPEPGAWWQPAHLGGGAMAEAERIAADARDIRSGRHRRQ